LPDIQAVEPASLPQASQVVATRRGRDNGDRSPGHQSAWTVRPALTRRTRTSAWWSSASFALAAPTGSEDTLGRLDNLRMNSRRCSGGKMTIGRGAQPWYVRVTIQECRSPSTLRLFAPASWPPCGARLRWARLAQHGGLRWAKSGSSFAASRACGLTAYNVFLYHHPKQPGAPIVCDFGVEVTRTFATVGEVHATETPAGEAAVAVHRGPYHRMNEAYTAIDKWMTANQRESAGQTWEIYGDPTPDPADTETTVVHLLRAATTSVSKS
jgi:GyrI-like small molecule binding protein